MATSVTTYKNEQDRVLELISKSDSTTRNRIKNWLNMGYLDFVGRELWPFREATGTLNLVQGTQEYNLTSNFADIDASNINSVTIQGSTNAKMSYWAYNQLRADQPDFDLIGQSVPTRYYLHAGSIGFWPTPNAASTVFIDYYLTPTEMSADADEPIIPVAYREALVQYALSLEHDFNSDADFSQKAMNRYEDILTSARNNLLVLPGDTGSFTILGPADFKNSTIIGI